MKRILIFKIGYVFAKFGSYILEERYYAVELKDKSVENESVILICQVGIIIHRLVVYSKCILPDFPHFVRIKFGAS